MGLLVQGFSLQGTLSGTLVLLQSSVVSAGCSDGLDGLPEGREDAEVVVNTIENIHVQKH